VERKEKEGRNYEKIGLSFSRCKMKKEKEITSDNGLSQADS